MLSLHIALDLNQSQAFILDRTQLVMVQGIVQSPDGRVSYSEEKVCGPGMWTVKFESQKIGMSISGRLVSESKVERFVFERVKETPPDFREDPGDLTAEGMQDYLMKEYRTLIDQSEMANETPEIKAHLREKAGILWLISKKIEAAEALVEAFGTRVPLSLKAADALDVYLYVGRAVGPQPGDHDEESEFDDWEDEGDD